MDDQTGVVDSSSEEQDPFSAHAPLAGLEHLGRHIRDKRGAPSGSPANFQALRGVLDSGEIIPTPEDIADQERRLIAQLTATDLAPLAAPPTSN